MNIFKLCAAILQDFGHPKNRCWHTQLNVDEKEGFPCFLYLIQIFAKLYCYLSCICLRLLKDHFSNKEQLQTLLLFTIVSLMQDHQNWCLSNVQNAMLIHELLLFQMWRHSLHHSCHPNISSKSSQNQ